MSRFTDDPPIPQPRPAALPQEVPLPQPRPAQLLQAGKPGYGQNMTLAALMAKQQEIAAQGGDISHMESGTPMEGLAMMAQSFVNSLKARRAEKAAETGQAEVSKALTDLNWDTGEMSPEAREVLFRRAPDTGLDLLKTFAELRAKKADTAATTEGKGFEQEQGLRKEYVARPEYKRFETTASSYQRVLTGANDGTAAGDMAVVYGFMKMQDPDSAVRESEYATAENARGVDESIRNVWNRLRKGERLTTNQKKMFASLAEKQYADSTGTINKLNDYYSGVARAHGIDPAAVVTMPQDFGKLEITGGDDSAQPEQDPDTPAEPPLRENGQVDEDKLQVGQIYLFKGKKARFQGLDADGVPTWSMVP